MDFYCFIYVLFFSFYFFLIIILLFFYPFNMYKKEQPVRFEPKNISLGFSNPPRYHLS